METSNPELRTFPEDAFKMSSHHTYDVWQWMTQKGYYPLEAAQPETLGTVASIYKVVENIPTLQ